MCHFCKDLELLLLESYASYHHVLQSHSSSVNIGIISELLKEYNVIFVADLENNATS